MDLFTKRFLSVCLGLSAVLLSASLLLFSLKTITESRAETRMDKWLPAGPALTGKAAEGIMKDSIQAGSADENVQAVQAFGLGIRDGILYFGILYNNNTIGLHKTEFDSQDIIHW